MEKNIKSASTLYKELDAKEAEIKDKIKHLDDKYKNSKTCTVIVVNNDITYYTVTYRKDYSNVKMANILGGIKSGIAAYSKSIQLGEGILSEEDIKELHPYNGMDFDEIMEVMVDSRYRHKLKMKLIDIISAKTSVRKLYTPEELLQEQIKKVEEEGLLK